jgi:hypothetical protein
LLPAGVTRVTLPCALPRKFHNHSLPYTLAEKPANPELSWCGKNGYETG